MKTIVHEIRLRWAWHQYSKAIRRRRRALRK